MGVPTRKQMWTPIAHSTRPTTNNSQSTGVHGKSLPDVKGLFDVFPPGVHTARGAVEHQGDAVDKEHSGPHLLEQVLNGVSRMLDALARDLDLLTPCFASIGALKVRALPASRVFELLELLVALEADSARHGSRPRLGVFGFDKPQVASQRFDLGVARVAFAVLDAQDGVVSDTTLLRDEAEAAYALLKRSADLGKEVDLFHGRHDKANLPRVSRRFCLLMVGA